MRWLTLLACCVVWMPNGWAKDPDVYPPTGLQPFLGLDDTSAPTRLQPGRAQSLQNVTIGLSADLTKRPGLAVIGGSLAWNADGICAVTGLTYAQFAGSTARIVALCGQRAFYLNGTTWTPINFTQGQGNPLITSGQNNQFVFTTALSTLISTNDVDAPFQWAGAASDSWQAVTFTGLTNAVQSARVTTFFQNYLLFGNTVEAGTRYPTRIRWSNIGTVNTWSNNDYTDVDAPAGQDLNCIGQLFGDVYLGFTSSLYRMSLVGGSGTFTFTKVSNEVGCAAKNSMQQVTLGNGQTGLLFLDSKRRVYFFNGIVPIETSQLIHTTLNTVNGSRLQYAVSAKDDEHYYLCLSGSGSLSNNLCLDYNFRIQEWSKQTNENANAMATVLDGNLLRQVYMGTLQSFVYQTTGTSLTNDVGSGQGTVSAVSTFATSYASSLQVLYDASAAYTVSGLIGAPIELTGGAASGLIGVVADNTATGVVVVTAFSSLPDSTTTYLVGRINAYYTTRWDDFGEPARIKNGMEMLLVADANIGSTLAVGYAVDFQSNTATPSASFTPSAGSIWGTAVWGTAVWGGGDIVLSRLKLEDDGRWWRWTFTENDLSQTFRLHGWQVLYEKGDNL